MEFEDVVRRRRMVRDYTGEPVDPAVVARALDLADRAPSAGATRGRRFVVRDTPDGVRRWWLAAAGSSAVEAPDRWLTGMMSAPVVVVPCSDRPAYLARYAEPDKARARAQHGVEGSPWTVPYWHLDTAMSALLVLMTAVDEGLGACFFGVQPARADAVRRELDLPDGVEPVGAITLGHPARRATGQAPDPS